MKFSAVLLMVVVLVLVLDIQRAETKGNKPKNLIFFIADGLSPTSITFARQAREKGHLPMEKYFCGSIETHSASSRITDSAAAATAYSCARKTINEFVAVLEHQQQQQQQQQQSPVYRACGTIMEAAKWLNKMTTALVVTSRITHATPASFSSHVSFRDYEDDIAVQQAVEQNVDLLFGGGLKHYTGRSDKRNLLVEMNQRGYQSITSLSEFEKTNLSLPLIGLFAPSHMDYEIDRVRANPINQPSFAQMVSKALSLLEQQQKQKQKQNQSDNGFFMMAEASKIDLAAHDWDASSHYWEISQYQDAFTIVEDFVRRNPDTLVVATSDHATGGISLGRNFPNNSSYPLYQWFPEPVLKATGSAFKMAEEIQAGASINETILKYTGIAPTMSQILSIRQAMVNNEDKVMRARIGQVVSDIALIGWTTIGHTAVDVPLYAFGHSSELFRGVYDNTQFANQLAELFDFDVDTVSDMLRDMVIRPPPDDPHRRQGVHS